MELTYNDLKKRDVINVVDGKCFGRVNNLSLSFPRGVLTGIYVPARKNKGFFWFLDKSSLFISVDKIVKIGGDVILVDIKCGENCVPSTPVGKKEQIKKPNPCPPQCPPPCPPSCPPNHPCPPPCPPNQPCTPFSPSDRNSQDTVDLSGLFDDSRIDLEDY
ncbi:MAG: hypothetical protein E7348_00700 [Clostridiales bacterium]|nr:hypothetical protein [Clostridiales bacterium]